MSVAILSENYQNELYKFEHVLPAINNAYYWKELATYYNDTLKEREKAKIFFLNALELDDNDDDTYCEIAWIFHHQKKYKDAIQYFLKSIKINPTYPRFYYWLAKNYIKIKDYNNAVKSYLKAIRVEYRFAERDYYNDLADCYVLMKQPKKAIKTIMSYVKKSPFITSKYSLARIYAECEEKKMALIWLEYVLVIKQTIDVKRIKKEKAFKRYKNDEDFKALLAKYA